MGGLEGCGGIRRPLTRTEFEISIEDVQEANIKARIALAKYQLANLPFVVSITRYIMSRLLEVRSLSTDARLG